MAKLALTSAIQNAFPNIEMKGCHFHYAQCLWKFVMDSGQWPQMYIVNGVFSPSLYTCSAKLFKFRNWFLARNPATSADFDTYSDYPTHGSIYFQEL